MSQITVMCLVCEVTFDEGDQCAIEGKHSGALYGVCPTCRRHAEIGKRVEGMKPRRCTAKVWNGAKFVEIPGLLHGFFQSVDADESYPVAVVEADCGIVYRPLAEDVVLEEKP